MTSLKNLFLAGDWTDAGLPATIEGSVRSGDRAADLVLARSGLAGTACVTGFTEPGRESEGCLANAFRRQNNCSRSRRGGRPRCAGEEHLRRRPKRCLATGNPMDTLCSSWKPTAPSRRNISCCGIISPSPSTARSKPRSRTICAARKAAHGGWPLVQDGPFDMSASVKSYFALKMIGDSVDAPHMVRAREAIRSRGGAARVNVFTRFLLAFYGVLTWRAVPVLPVEIMLLPMWSPFHLNKISYWARTTIVPLMVMAALKPLAKNPKGCRPRRVVPAGSQVGRNDAEGAAPELGLVHAVQHARQDPARRSSRCFRKAAPARDRCGARLHAKSGSTARTAWARSIRRWPTSS